MKKNFLSGYDSGTGGVYNIICARTKYEVTKKYPMLVIFDNRPSWIDDQTYEALLATSYCDIDDPPPSWLLLALEDWTLSGGIKR
jgi:hypothetical protein